MSAPSPQRPAMSRDAPRPLRAAELIEHPDGALARLAQPAGRPNPDGALAQALRPEPESAIELHHPAHRLELLGLLGPIERLHHPHQVPRRGDPRPDNLMYRVFKPAARAAGMPELTFHDLRHTGASLMIAAGCHVKVIAEQMGHSDGAASCSSARATSTRARGARRPSRSRHTSSAGPAIPLWDRRGMTASWGSILTRPETQRSPPERAFRRERTTGLEPATFGLGSRRRGGRRG